MPELPEVETIVRDIRPALLGRRFRSALLSHSDVLRGVSKRRLLRSLTGARILDVTRRAKHAILHLEGGQRFVLQPGMTGSIVVYDSPLSNAEATHAVLRAPLDDGREFVFRDVRRLGTLLLLDPRGWAAYDQAMGPEPLDPRFAPEDFRRTLAGSRQAIKKVLMDQRRLAGVGNIYANEALFAAGIDPSRPANRIAAEEFRRLYRELRRLLQAAIDAEGTTFRDYRTGTGQAGSFQLELQVYEREGAPCRRCGASLAGTHAIDARITVFCWRCQR